MVHHRRLGCPDQNGLCPALRFARARGGADGLNPAVATQAVHSEPKDRASLYLIGVPGKLGGASTKILHLIRLLHEDFHVTLVAPGVAVHKDKEVRRSLEPYGIGCTLLKDLPKNLSGVALAICDKSQ
jgi:hypothetical protein